MKTFLAITLCLISFSAFSLVESKNCPDAFSISYFDISRAPLTAEIENSWSLKIAWDSIHKIQKTEQVFKISSRTNSALCVYTDGKVAAFLQTNNGIDELFVPFNENVNLFFRSKILTFSSEYIELAVDEESKSIYGQKLRSNSEGGYESIGESVIGSAQAINIQVLE